MSRHYVFLRPDEIFGIERIVSARDDSASSGVRGHFSFSYRVSCEVGAVFWGNSAANLLPKISGFTVFYACLCV